MTGPTGPTESYNEVATVLKTARPHVPAPTVSPSPMPPAVGTRLAANGNMLTSANSNPKMNNTNMGTATKETWGAAAIAIVHAQAGFDVAQQVVGFDERIDLWRNHRRTAHAATYEYARTQFAILTDQF